MVKEDKIKDCEKTEVYFKKKLVINIIYKNVKISYIYMRLCYWKKIKNLKNF